MGGEKSEALLNEVLKRPHNYIDKAIEIIARIVDTTKSGDILLFVESKANANIVCNTIKKTFDQKDIFCIVLYRGLPKEQLDIAISADQYKKISGNSNRKLVVSTNIAETGVTIDGVLFVIDCGLEFINSYEDRTEILSKEFISKNSVKQRLGRAGRTAPGTCYHLYTKQEYEKMSDFRPPEILSQNIDQVILQLLSSGIVDKLIPINKFTNTLITPPKEKTVLQSIEFMAKIGLVDYKCERSESERSESKRNESERSESERSKQSKRSGNKSKPIGSKQNKNKFMVCLSQLGNCVSKLGIDPSLGVALLASYKYDVTDEILIIVSMLSASDRLNDWLKQVPFKSPQQKQLQKFKNKISSDISDVLALLKLYNLSFNNRKERRFINEESLQIAISERKRISNRLRNIGSSCRLTNFIQPSDHDEAIVFCFLYGICSQYASKSGNQIKAKQSKQRDRSEQNKRGGNKRNKQSESKQGQLYLLNESSGFKNVRIETMKNNFIKKKSDYIFYLGKRRIEGKEFVSGIFNVNKDTINKFKC
jgi:HrpA-like RNA helicase